MLLPTVKPALVSPAADRRNALACDRSAEELPTPVRAGWCHHRQAARHEYAWWKSPQGGGLVSEGNGGRRAHPRRRVPSSNALTRMPLRPPHCWARVPVRADDAGLGCGVGRLRQTRRGQPRMLAMLMIELPGVIPPPAGLRHPVRPLEVDVDDRRNSSRGPGSSGTAVPMPALLIRMSTRPNGPTVASTRPGTGRGRRRRSAPSGNAPARRPRRAPRWRPSCRPAGAERDVGARFSANACANATPVRRTRR